MSSWVNKRRREPERRLAARIGCPTITLTGEKHGKHQPGASGLHRAEGDVEAIQRSVRGRGALATERVRVPGAASKGAGAGVRGAAAASVLRELRGVDRGLVRRDVDAAGTDAAV